MNTKNIIRTGAFAVLAVVLALTAAACGSSFDIGVNGHTATCSANVKKEAAQCSMNGNTVTVGPGHHHKPTTGTTATDVTPTPTREPVISPSANIPGATAPAPDESAAVTTCLSPDPSRDTLVSFTHYNSSGAEDLATCLAIPPQMMKLFLHLLYQYAVNAYNQGDFDSDQGRQGFAQPVTTAAQRCHAGQAE
jgi:hypothetical protein